MRTATAQRLRVTFAVEGAWSYASVLDLGRAWERLLRRARLPLAYSQGYNPHPRLQFAAALPVGYTSLGEMVDLWLAERVLPQEAAQAMAQQSPPGLGILEVEEVPLAAPSLQGLIRAAEYRVWLVTLLSSEAVRAALEQLLAQEQIPRRRRKKDHLADYDLRPLIFRLEYRSTIGTTHEVEMLLRCGQAGSGRPEEILEAAGLPVEDRVIQRLRLLAGADGEERG